MTAGCCNATLVAIIAELQKRQASERSPRRTSGLQIAIHTLAKGGKHMSREWSDTLSAFWYGANGCEYIAYKGSHQVFEFPCYEYPNAPTRIIQHTTRIETLEEFNDALDNGEWFIATYTKEVSE